MLEDVLNEFKGTYTIKPFDSEADSDDDGLVEVTYSTTGTIEAVIQPLSPNELRNVPEGQNELQWKNIWSNTEFFQKDLIYYEGEAYEVQRKEYWHEEEYWHGQIVRVEE